MADSYVTSQATLKCSFGDKTSKLTVYPDRTVFLTGKPMANISDRISLYNIAPFGKCRTTGYPATAAATAANKGKLTPMPCVPGTVSDWVNGKNDYIIKGKPALLKSSFCKCQWGGIITVTNDGQVDTGSADMSKEQPLTEEEMVAENEAAQEVTQEEILEGIQCALDIAGFVPVVGAFADILNASISAYRGDWVSAGISLLAAVPGIGDAAGAAKLAQKGVKIATSKGAKKTIANASQSTKSGNQIPTNNDNCEKVINIDEARKKKQLEENITRNDTSNVVSLKEYRETKHGQFIELEKVVGGENQNIPISNSINGVGKNGANYPSQNNGQGFGNGSSGGNYPQGNKKGAIDINKKKKVNTGAILKFGGNNKTTGLDDNYPEDSLKEIFRYKGNQPHPHNIIDLDLNS